MSVLLFAAEIAAPILVKVTGNSATTIVDATEGPIQVAWFQVNEVGGTVQNLTVDMYDGTLTYYLGDTLGPQVVWKTRAVTAGLSLLFDRGYVVPKGFLLRVTSSDAAGKFDVIGLKAAARS